MTLPTLPNGTLASLDLKSQPDQQPKVGFTEHNLYRLNIEDSAAHRSSPAHRP
jgi:hypothetical protein